MGLYLTEFVDFVDSILPSVDPEAKNKAKAAIEQFIHSGNTFEYFTPKILPVLSQGDIISEIMFSYLKEDGKQCLYKAKGMIISTSCHIDQKELMNIVPIFPLSFLKADKNKEEEIKKNRVFDYMYFPENKMQNLFVDFSRVNTFDKKLIFQGLENGRISRIASLSQIGLYLFIIKLTVFLMRKEDTDTMKKRIM